MCFLALCTVVTSGEGSSSGSTSAPWSGPRQLKHDTRFLPHHAELFFARTAQASRHQVATPSPPLSCLAAARFQHWLCSPCCLYKLYPAQAVTAPGYSSPRCLGASSPGGASTAPGLATPRCLGAARRGSRPSTAIARCYRAGSSQHQALHQHATLEPSLPGPLRDGSSPEHYGHEEHVYLRCTIDTQRR
jgi:hypothetical protein